MNFRSLLLIALAAVFSTAAAGQNIINPNYLSARMETGAARSVPATTAAATSAAALLAIEQSTFALINAERVRAGLPLLNWNEKVAKVARLHSQSMADYNFFSHKGLDGLMVDDRAQQIGVGSWQAIGENIAFMKGYDNPAAVAVEKWLLSASHKNNLLGTQWKDSAIGVAMTEDGKCYFTQVFLLNK